jgi:hypothetical protein
VEQRICGKNERIQLGLYRVKLRTVGIHELLYTAVVLNELSHLTEGEERDKRVSNRDRSISLLVSEDEA